jgi:hypothetical protein
MVRNLRLIAAFLFCLVPSVAFAQQPPPPRPQTLDDRVGAQIGALVLRTTSQDMQIELLQKQLAAAQARVKELEEAAAKPAPDAPAAK